MESIGKGLTECFRNPCRAVGFSVHKGHFHAAEYHHAVFLFVGSFIEDIEGCFFQIRDFHFHNDFIVMENFSFVFCIGVYDKRPLPCNIQLLKTKIGKIPDPGFVQKGQKTIRPHMPAVIQVANMDINSGFVSILKIKIDLFHGRFPVPIRIRTVNDNMPTSFYFRRTPNLTLQSASTGKSKDPG